MHVEHPHLKFPFEISAGAPELRNLLTNSHLETDITGWTKAGIAGSTIEHSTAHPQDGTGAIKCTATPPNDANWMEVYPPYMARADQVEKGVITPSASFFFILRYYGETVPAGTRPVHLRVQWFDADDAYISESTSTVHVMATGDQEVVLGTSPPPGAAACFPFLRFYGPEEGTGGTFVVHLDSLFLGHGWATWDTDYVDGYSPDWEFDTDGSSVRPASGRVVSVVQQDDAAHVLSCENVIVRCPVGFRLDRPEFGIPWPEYQQQIDVDGIQAALRRWEPRSHATVREVENLVARAQGESRITVEVEA